MDVRIRPFEIEDYAAVRILWEHSEGLGLSPADSREGTQRYLARNPGLSFVAFVGEQCVGVVLCGHDGGAASGASVATSSRSGRSTPCPLQTADRRNA